MAKRMSKKAARSAANGRSSVELPFVEMTASVVDARIEIEVEGVVVRVPNDFDRDALGRVLELLGRKR